MQSLETQYISLFRSLVLNTPLRNEIPLIKKEYTTPLFWDFLAWNRIIPLLYHRISQQNLKESFPEAFMVRLKALQQKSILHSLQMEGVIKEVISLLRKENIQPFLLKGIALAFAVYENPALRPMLDIDLLFTGDGQMRAHEILKAKGSRDMYAQESKYTMGLWQHIPPVQYKNVIIELHSHIAAAYEPGFLPLEQVVENPDIITMGEHSCFALNPEMQVYHLLTHMHKHVLSRYSRLIWLADLHLYLTRHQHTFDWNKFWKLAETTGLTPCFEKYLRLLKNVLNTQLPISENDEHYAEEFLGICRRIVAGENTIGTMGMMKKLVTTRQKILFLKGKLFPSVEYVKRKFNIKNRNKAIMYYSVLYMEYLRKLFKT